MEVKRQERLKHLANVLSKLTDGQVRWIESIVGQFNREYSFTRLESSDLVTSDFLQDFGDGLRIHHCFSKESFSKDKFEYLIENILTWQGIEAQLANEGNPGHDITIKGERFSLKTQADRQIKKNQIHITKFMELGKGKWHADEKDLIGLRKQFFKHMKVYGRILSLRNLLKSPNNWHYELVEIPKTLLLEAKKGTLEMRHNSKQIPKPGYCHVYDKAGNIKFQLYFNGGGERKLQIKKLDKNLCLVHAEWSFPP